MKIFISWSGQYSKEWAEILKDWIKCTLQASDPWISSQDIDKGSLWFSEISDQLKETKVGIVCLTKGNKEKPWILFESGALARGLSSNRVCTFLINLKPSDLEGPLSQFNHTLPDADGMKSLLITINKELGESALEDSILEQIFDVYWPTFEEKFKKLEDSEPRENANKPPRSDGDILEEILYTTRTMNKRIRSLERNDRNKRFAFSNKFPSKDEVRHMIDQLIDTGAGLDEIADKLHRFGPKEMLVEEIVKRLNRKTALLKDDGDNDEEIPFKLKCWLWVYPCQFDSFLFPIFQHCFKSYLTISRSAFILSGKKSIDLLLAADRRAAEAEGGVF